MELLDFSHRKKCADVSIVDKRILYLFYLTNLPYLFIAINQKDLVNKIFMYGIFIVSSLFHLSQINKCKNPYDKNTVFFLNCDIGYAIFGSLLMIIYKHKNLNSLNILILIITLIFFEIHRIKHLHNGYNYIILHSIWHFISAFGLYNFLNNYNFNDYNLF